MSLKIVSFCHTNGAFPPASICVPGEQILIMNRRAKWPIIVPSTIDPASRQVVLRNTGKGSIGRCKIFGSGVSILIQRSSNRAFSESTASPRSLLQPRLMSVGEEMLEDLDSQAVAVKVEVCVSVPETVTCVAFTPGVWRSANEDYCILSRKTTYQPLYMLLIRSW